ncbi:alginate export family protein [Halopseudomonas salegens]|uniref:Alginate export n=1 Tax=Halopseudomonas salegens TaxID=1434072 RepID=A0A1H2ETE2_9GAMM|nr:alginate export family protein [Halopseudomonas salegens]SDT98341.1 Alginate export [Halopseudomonas salegens]
MQQQTTGKKHLWLPLLGSVVAMSALPVQAESGSLMEAIQAGKAGLDLRYRFEHVEQDNQNRNANASTLRTRLNYATDSYQHLSAFIEFDDIRVLGSTRYNNASGRPSARTQYPVVADPSGTEVNQAYLNYSGLPNTTLRLGRQRIIYDNARFIGNVGWRQNEQTYDAFSLVNTSLSDTTLSYAYIDQVNRIFGKDSPKGETSMRSHLLNASYGGLPVGQLTAYGYFLETPDTPLASNRTLGLRFNGSHAASEQLSLLYALEYAKQDDFQDGDSAIDADYHLMEVGATLHGITARVGQEVLGADGSAFSTPLATAHAFNGWADTFLTTPADGLDDRYLKLAGRVQGTNLLAAWHQFHADQGSADYGRELNLQAARSFGPVKLLAKYARYSAKDLGTDTEKFWLMAQVAF